MGQCFGWPFPSKNRTLSGSLPPGRSPPQRVGGGRIVASRHGALVKYGSSSGHSLSFGLIQICTLLKPPTPTCAQPVTGIGSPALAFSGL